MTHVTHYDLHVWHAWHNWHGTRCSQRLTLVTMSQHREQCALCRLASRRASPGPPTAGVAGRVYSGHNDVRRSEQGSCGTAGAHARFKCNAKISWAPVWCVRVRVRVFKTSLSACHAGYHGTIGLCVWQSSESCSQNRQCWLVSSTLEIYGQSASNCMRLPWESSFSATTEINRFVKCDESCYFYVILWKLYSEIRTPHLTNLGITTNYTSRGITDV